MICKNMPDLTEWLLEITYSYFIFLLLSYFSICQAAFILKPFIKLLMLLVFSKDDSAPILFLS